MAVARTASFKPGVESPEQIFEPAPVKKCTGVEESDRPNSC